MLHTQRRIVDMCIILKNASTILVVTNNILHLIWTYIQFGGDKVMPNRDQGVYLDY